MEVFLLYSVRTRTRKSATGSPLTSPAFQAGKAFGFSCERSILFFLEKEEKVSCSFLKKESKNFYPFGSCSLADVGFYHLTRTAADQALPALLGRTLAAGERAAVLCAAERLATLDAGLWACTEPDWLPHGTTGGAEDALQPILLAAADWPGPPPNGAQFLFVMDSIEVSLDRFKRVFDLFDGRDEAAVMAARARWKVAKAAGHTLTYLQQGPKGWETKA
jgi:DNA polymerase-3 subunit chi